MSRGPVSTFARLGPSPILVFADHASNSAPAELGSLGVSSDVLASHIGYDIGAAALAEAVSRILGGSLLLCGFTRLVVDPNRDPAAGDLIPAESDRVIIPGNADLSDAERRHRVDAYFEPYHRDLATAIDDVGASSGEPFLLSVHSFTPQMAGGGSPRPWGAGVLWSADAESAATSINWLRRHSPWKIGDNEPYDGRLYGYTMDRHAAPRGLKHITIEVRQDLVSGGEGVALAARYVSGAVLKALNRTKP